MACVNRENCKLPFSEEVVAKVAGCYAPESKETKTKLVIKDGVINAEFYAGGVPIGGGTLIPDVTNVREITKDGSPKVVVVSFADGTTEKAVLDANDTYSLEQGVSICITKKLLGRNTSYGGALYNKVIKRALDVMQENEEERVALAKAEAAEEERTQKQIAKKKARREKIAAMEKERQIEIQKEAYIRAIKAMREEDKAEISEAVDEFGKFIENLIEEAEKEAAEEDNKETEQTVSETNAE